MYKMVERIATTLMLEWLLFCRKEPTIWRSGEDIPADLEIEKEPQKVDEVFIAEGGLHKRNDVHKLQRACVRAMRTRNVVGCVVTNKLDGPEDEPELKTVIFRFVVAPDG